MIDIAFTLRTLDSSQGLAGLKVQLGQVFLTRLMRPGSNVEDIELRIPPGPFGAWLAENWWRLRWECRPLNGFTAEWRESHDMAAIGAGHAWPNVSFWGEGQRIMVLAKADPPGVMGPVRFLQDALSFVSAKSFEAAIDAILESVGDMVEGEHQGYFRALVQALNEERNDPDVSAWRRLEAINGFDPDQAPEEIISSLLELSERFAAADVEEAAASYPGIESAHTLKRLIDETDANYFTDVDFAGAINSAGRVVVENKIEPWQMAEEIASRIREKCGAGCGPLRNSKLADLVGVNKRVLTNHQTIASGLAAPYGLRFRPSPTMERVLLQTRWSHDRRFELMRALGDTIWSEGSSLGPLSKAGTARQKFQRAFAASMLCPLTALRDYLGDVDPSDTDIAAAARHFHVSERVVRSVLVNKHMMDRNRIEAPVNIAQVDGSIEYLADAA